MFCNKCEKNKDESDFYVNKSNSRGYNYHCKDCEKLYQLQYKRTRRKNLLFLNEERKKDLKRYTDNRDRYNHNKRERKKK